MSAELFEEIERFAHKRRGLKKKKKRHKKSSEESGAKPIVSAAAAAIKEPVAETLDPELDMFA